MSLYVVPHLPILQPKVPPVISGNLVGREPAVVLPQPWAVQSGLSLNVEAAVCIEWHYGSDVWRPIEKMGVQNLYNYYYDFSEIFFRKVHQHWDIDLEICFLKTSSPAERFSRVNHLPKFWGFPQWQVWIFPPDISGQKTSVAMGATKAKWQIPNWRDGVIYEENAQQLSQLSPAFGTRERLGEDWKTVPDPNEAPSTGDW